MLILFQCGLANVEDGAADNGGDVLIDAPVLEVTDGTQLNASPLRITPAIQQHCLAKASAQK